MGGFNHVWAEMERNFWVITTQWNKDNLLITIYINKYHDLAYETNSSNGHFVGPSGV